MTGVPSQHSSSATATSTVLSGNAKSRRMLLFALSLPMLVLLGMLAWPLVRQQTARWQLNDQIETLRIQGVPIDNESMSEFRDGLASGADAKRWQWAIDTLDSPAYLDSIQGLPIAGDENFQSPPPGEPWEYDRDVQVFLSEWSEFRDEVHALCEDSGPVRMPLEFDSYHTLLPHIQAHHGFSRLLVLEHQFAVSRGDDELCTRNLLALLGLVRTHEFEPFMASHLFRYQVMDRTHDCLQRAVKLNLLSDSQWARIDAALSELKFADAYQNVILGERAMLVTAFDEPGMLRELEGSKHQQIQDLMTCLRWFDSLAEFDVDAFEADAFLDFLNQQQQRIDDEIIETSIVTRYDQFVAGLPFPDLVTFGKQTVAQELNRRLARLAIAVRRYRIQTESWPETLADLNQIGVEEAALRPSSGKPFGYRVANKTATLWGMQPNSSRDQTPADPPAPKKIEFSERLNPTVWKLLP